MTPTRHISVSPESNLLFACMSAPWNPEARERVRALADGPIDWDRVQHFAKKWRVLEILYATLRDLGHPRVSSGLLETLESHYRANGARNLRVTSACVRILALFGESGIRCAPYKGPMLASGLYDNFALRQISDLDFLMPREQIPLAVELLEKQGFQLDSRSKAMDLLRLARYKSQYDVNLISPALQIRIELHWGILPVAALLGLKPDFFWNWLRPRRRLGADVLLFPPEEQFFLLCLHNEKHRWHIPRFTVDVLRMLDTQPDLDWGRIHRLCDESHRHEAVDGTLQVIQDILGCPVPPEAWTGRVAQERLAGAVALVRSRLFAHEFSLPPYSEWKACLGLSRSGPAGAKEAGVRGYLRALLAHDYSDQCHDPTDAPRPLLLSGIRVLRFLKYYCYTRYRSPLGFR